MKNEREINRQAEFDRQEGLLKTLNQEQKMVILEALKYSHQFVKDMPNTKLTPYHEGFIKYWGFLEEKNELHGDCKVLGNIEEDKAH